MSARIPEWRLTAPGGVSLATAGGRLAGRTGGPALPQKLTLVEATRQPATNVPAELARIIRAEAQPRWLLPYISMLTPQYIETILRGALVGNHLFQWQLFDMMEDTWPRLVKNLNELKRAAIAEFVQRWRLQAWTAQDAAPTPEAKERAGLVKEALFGMIGQADTNQNGFEDTLYDILDAWGKGTSLLELEYEVRQTETYGQIMAPTSTFWIHPKNYAWDGTGRLGLVLPNYEGPETVWPFARTDQQMQPYGSSDGLLPIVEDKFLLAICRARTGHPLGAALLRPLAWWWCASNFASDWLLNFAQVFGMPMRWATYAQGAPQETVDAICGMLANMGSQAWAAFPAGTDLQLKEASKGSDQLPQGNVIDRADTQCDLLILGETLTSHLGTSGGGSRALGEVHERVRDDTVHAAAGFLARVLNTQAVPAILRLNYGDDSQRPSFVPSEEDPDAAKTTAEVLAVAIQSGVPVPVDFALEKLHIPKAEEGEELVQPPKPAAPGPGDGAPGAPGPGEPKKVDGASTPEAPGEKMDGTSVKAEAPAVKASAAAVLERGATEQIVNSALEDLTGVQAKWLGGVKPFFAHLVLLAKSGSVTDADFVKALGRARAQLPELFHKMDGKTLAGALEKAMGAAVVNGAARGSMERKTK